MGICFTQLNMDGYEAFLGRTRNRGVRVIIKG
jgi:hypothetical protein